MKTHHPEIKKDPLYQEALYKVYKNNPELIESQQKSNAEKKQHLNAIKINKICMAFSIIYVLFMALLGTLLNEIFWYEIGIGSCLSGQRSSFYHYRHHILAPDG